MRIEIEKEELDRLLETIRQQAEQIEKLEGEVRQLKELLEKKADAKSAKKPRFSEDYSVDRHKRKQNDNKNASKKSTGRRSNNAKRKLATVNIDVYPDGV